MTEQASPAAPRLSLGGLGRHWLLLATLCLYLPSLAAGFIYDDIPLIADNGYAQRFEYLGRAFTTHFWDTARGDQAQTLRYYRPFITVSYIVDWQLARGAPFVFHLHNTLAHVLAVGLAARFARRLLGTQSRLWLLPVLLFAFHPTRIESVLWISGRTDLWLSVWMLLAVESAAIARKRARPGLLLISGACAVAALLSKESAVILPLLLLADRAGTGGTAPTPGWLYRHGDVLAAGALSLAYLAFRAVWLPVGTSFSSFTPTAFLAASEGYLQRLLWPIPEGFFFRPLAVDDEGTVHSLWQVALGAFVVLAFVALLVDAFRRQRAAFWLLLCAVVSLAPVLHLVPTGLPVLVADRFLYLPLLLLALGLCLRFQTQLNALVRRFPRLSLVVLSAIPVSFVACLASVLPDYESEHAFWQAELERRPCNPTAHEHLATLAAARSELARAKQHLLTTLGADCIALTLYHRQLPLKAYARVLELEAAHTADGDHRKLSALAQRLTDLYRGNLRPAPAISGLKEPAPAFFRVLGEQRRHLPNKGTLAAEIAGLRARLGQDQTALAWAKRAHARPLGEQAAPANLVLTLARLNQFSKAAELIARLEQAKPSALITPERAAELRERVQQAATATQAATSRSPLQAAMLRAEAQANLGAYARALRILKPSVQADPRPPQAVLYVQLLVAARLEREAYELLTQTQSPDRARQILGQIQLSLSPELKSIAPVSSAAY